MKFLRILTFITILSSLFALNSCGLYKKVDQRELPDGASAKARKNIEEGRGAGLGDMLGRRGGNTNYEFSTANPMWRATISLLEFTPLSNVDYSGGIIITDWFNDDAANQSIKITVKFLSNEIRSDAIKVIVYKKICDDQNNCKTNKIDTILEKEIKVAILKEAALIEENERIKNPDFKYPKIPE